MEWEKTQYIPLVDRITFEFDGDTVETTISCARFVGSALRRGLRIQQLVDFLNDCGMTTGYTKVYDVFTIMSKILENHLEDRLSTYRENHRNSKVSIITDGRYLIFVSFLGKYKEIVIYWSTQHNPVGGQHNVMCLDFIMVIVP